MAKSMRRNGSAALVTGYFWSSSAPVHVTGEGARQSGLEPGPLDHLAPSRHAPVATVTIPAGSA